MFRYSKISHRLMAVIMVTCSIVLLITCVAFYSYELFTFRKATVRQLSTLGEIIANNSTAALAFNIPEDANEILSALKAEPHIIAACLYDKEGKIFSRYPADLPENAFPEKIGAENYFYTSNHLEGFQPVMQDDRKLGMLFLKSDLKVMNERLQLYGVIIVLVIVISFILVYLISIRLQRVISGPILSLAETAKAISLGNDYSVRAVRPGTDELGALTDAFNHMLIQIQYQNKTLNEFNQLLEQKVAERTLELETVNKELESFSYSVSHDLRSPLRAIHGFTNILAEDYVSKLDEEAKKLMEVIITNAQRMGQLIDDLLNFSQLGRKELVKQNISMKSVVAEIWEDLMVNENGRTIEFKLDELPEAYADYATIKQAWINLITNALKYSRKKEKTRIEISFEDKQDQVIYFIKDNGSGFDMKYYDKLFSVFQRLHSHKDFEGTGVGLAIVHRIISKHGGKVWAEGKQNEGATFYFSMLKTIPSIK